MMYVTKNKKIALELKHRRFGFTTKLYGDYDIIKFSDKNWEIVKIKIYGGFEK